jgi:hypothetical protein
MPITIKDIQDTLQSARKEACKARLALNGKTNWLAADSDAVMLEVAKAYHDVLLTIDDEPSDAQADLFKAADSEFLVIAHAMTNPSAFRQTLERNKVIKPIDAPARQGSSARMAADLI